jgi:protein-disulfide isomerase
MPRLKGLTAALVLLVSVASAPKVGAAEPFVSLCGGGDCVVAATTPASMAKVSLIAFSNFQCPFSGRASPTLEGLQEIYSGALSVTFLHNPLSFHKHSRLAAIASMAAARQGHFWQMHDLLFQNQRLLARADLVGYAKRLGLDSARFSRDLDDGQLAEFVDRSRNIATAVGATGTPAFFVNGKILKGAQPFEVFKQVIDEEIAAADAAGRHGVAWMRSRTRQHNATLAAYLWDGKVPPPRPAAASPPKRRPVDKTVYKVRVDPQRDAILGSPLALVTVVVFSDFQCPFCKRLEPVLKKLTTQYGRHLRLVFKHNPLIFHRDAQTAAHASLCAKEQGKFWEMHDQLFAHQSALQLESLEAYAREIGVDVSAYGECMKSDRYMPQIEADKVLAGKVTARGTPNTYINGRKLTGAKPVEEFAALVDEEMKKARGLLRSGVLPSEIYEGIIANGKIFEPLDEEVHRFDLKKAHRLGRRKVRVQIVVFSDFECPFSNAAYAPLQEVQTHFGRKAAVYFKHFPLSFHKEARAAAEASECAAQQGQFWLYHNLLFEHRKSLGEQTYKDLARQVGLNLQSFGRCLGTKFIADKVEANMAEARRSKVRGTPTIFINGRKFTSPSGYNRNAFISVINKYVLRR